MCGYVGDGGYVGMSVCRYDILAYNMKLHMQACSPGPEPKLISHTLNPKPEAKLAPNLDPQPTSPKPAPTPL